MFRATDSTGRLLGRLTRTLEIALAAAEQSADASGQPARVFEDGRLELIVHPAQAR